LLSIWLLLVAVALEAVTDRFLTEAVVGALEACLLDTLV
jgi:hypothetical protein